MKKIIKNIVLTTALLATLHPAETYTVSVKEKETITTKEIITAAVTCVTAIFCAWFCNSKYFYYVPYLSNASIADIISSAPRSDLIEIVKHKISIGADINKPSERGLSPIFEALSYGKNLVAKLLIESGANLKVRDTKGLTLIEYAALTNNYAVLKLLIESGAYHKITKDRMEKVGGGSQFQFQPNIMEYLELIDDTYAVANSYAQKSHTFDTKKFGTYIDKHFAQANKNEITDKLSNIIDLRVTYRKKLFKQTLKWLIENKKLTLPRSFRGKITPAVLLGIYQDLAKTADSIWRKKSWMRHYFASLQLDQKPCPINHFTTKDDSEYRLEKTKKYYGKYLDKFTNKKKIRNILAGKSNKTLIQLSPDVANKIMGYL